MLTTSSYAKENQSKPITRRPIFHPALVNITPFLIKPQVGAQPDASLPVGVLATRMDGVRIVEHHVARLVVRSQPLPLPPGLGLQEALGVLGEHPELLHVHVVGADAFCFRERGSPAREVVFDGASQGDGVGEVDQPSAVGGYVAW